MINILFQAIFTPLAVFNGKKCSGRKLATAIGMVVATAIMEAVIGPVVYYFIYQNEYDIEPDGMKMFLAFSVAILTWLAVCALFFTFAKVFRKHIAFRQIVATWGLSYIPDFLVVIFYYLLIIKPEIYNRTGFATFFISFFFIMLLIWKAIYYFMFMRFVIDTSLFEIAIITVISAFAFIALMMIGFQVGIQVPVL